MPRVKRVEFEDALYHISARGNRGLPIVEDDVDRERFFTTLTEVVEQTGWEVYAWALLDNHYHLVIRTPQANLVRGMTWFQNAITKRQNARHKQQGYLFAGRYKSILVEEGGCLQRVINYVNLAPVREGVMSLKQESVMKYRWGSLRDYLLPQKERRSFSAVSEGFKVMKCADTEKGYERFWMQANKVSGQEEVAYRSSMRAGWVMGSERFHDEMNYKLRSSDQEYYQNRQYRRDEQRALEIIDEGLSEYELEEGDLQSLRKNDRRKVEMALRIRAETTMNADWIGEHLHMGTRGSISNAIRKYREQ